MLGNREHRIAATVRCEIEALTRLGSEAVYPVIDVGRQTYMLISLPDLTHSLPARVLLLVRVVADWVIIYEDATNSSLMDALLQKGLAREKVVRADKGESLPDFTHVLAPLVKREVELYVARAHNAVLYPILDDERLTHAVVVVPNDRKTDTISLVNMARVVGDKVVIEAETVHDKPLVDALVVNAGIPREQIVLAYAGETIAATK